MTMLHKQASANKQSFSSLKNTAADWKYWQSLDIIQIRDLLWHDLIAMMAYDLSL